MNCFHCERPAHAGCIYCGRAVCRDHIKMLPHPLTTFRDTTGRLMALVTPEAVHCGHCMPHGRPVHLDSIDDALSAGVDSAGVDNAGVDNGVIARAR